MLVRADRVLPMTGEGVIRDGVVEVQRGRIRRVATAAEIGADADGDGVVHHRGATLLPGLIDAHTHLTLAGDGRSYEQYARDSDELMTLVAVRNMALHLGAGVTAVRDNGARNRTTFFVRDAVERGYVRGPRLLLSGRPLTQSRGHLAWCNGEADTAADVRARVRELVAEGADHIKIMASGGDTLGTKPEQASYPVAELAAAVTEAHAHERLTTAHCRARESISRALEAGMDCIEHAEFLEPAPAPGAPPSMAYDPGIAERIVGTGTYVSFTLQQGGYDTLVDLRARQGSLTGHEQRRRRALEGYYQQKLEVLARLREAGLGQRLVVSSDAGPSNVRFGKPVYGLELAVAGGMAPIEAITAMTRSAAEACGIGDLAGTLEAGKAADLLAVRGDPLVDVDAVADVEAVYLDGERMVDRVGAPQA